MGRIRPLLLALGSAAGIVALTVSAADAQYARYGYPYGGSYYSYGANRPNPGISPNGWDQDNPRDQQLQGTR